MQYLASPYSHESSEVIGLRFMDAFNHTAFLLYKGLIIYSPILHFHTLAKYKNIPTDFDFWKRHNFEMLSFASAIRVLTIPGWLESVGVQAEIKEAKRLGLEIFYDELGKETKTASGKVIGYISPIKADDLLIGKGEGKDESEL